MGQTNFGSFAPVISGWFAGQEKAQQQQKAQQQARMDEWYKMQQALGQKYQAENQKRHQEALEKLQRDQLTQGEYEFGKEMEFKRDELVDKKTAEKTKAQRELNERRQDEFYKNVRTFTDQGHSKEDAWRMAANLLVIADDPKFLFEWTQEQRRKTDDGYLAEDAWGKTSPKQKLAEDKEAFDQWAERNYLKIKE